MSDKMNVIRFSAAFLVRDKKVYIAQRSDGTWEFPGDTLTEDEKFDDTLETAFNAQFGTKPTIIQEVGSIEVDSSDQILMKMYILIEAAGEAPKEHQDAKFVSMDELKALDLIGPDKEFIKVYENEIKNYID